MYTITILREYVYVMESVCVDYNYIKGVCICDGECLCRL